MIVRYTGRRTKLKLKKKGNDRWKNCVRASSDESESDPFADQVRKKDEKT